MKDRLGILAISVMIAMGCGDDSPPPSSAVPIAIDASTLAAAYNNNTVSADENYKGKVLEISGSIGTIGKDIGGSPYVTFHTDPSNPYSENVQCLFEDAHANALQYLSKDQQATIKGTCDGQTISTVIVKDCQFEK